MQDGLHIGLAAWISARRAQGGFATWPALPFVLKLVNLEDLQTMRDLAQAAEFSRMVNFVPRKGQYAQPFSAAAPMWDVHRELLARMTFAVRAWTREEQATWESARAVLFDMDSGFPAMTPSYQLYQELRTAYRELEESQAESDELSMALASWISLGAKLEVEAALATIERLARRSSVTQAGAERAALDPLMLLSSANVQYAPTSFSPLSTLRPETWLEAEVTIDDLERSLGDSQPAAKWQAWRATRNGSVTFRYATLDLHRPWFNMALYRSDDWRLDNDEVAARGDGATGVLPAHVRSLYLVKLGDLRIQSAPATTVAPSRPAGSLPARSLRHSNIKPGLQRTRQIRAKRKELSISGIPRLGVTAPLPNTKAQLAKGSATLRKPVVPVLPLSAQALPARATNVGTGRVRNLTLAGVASRIAVTQALIASRFPSPIPHPVPSPPPDTATEQEIYVVGFGCTPLPASPLPNPDYQWSA